VTFCESMAWISMSSMSGIESWVTMNRAFSARFCTARIPLGRCPRLEVFRAFGAGDHNQPQVEDEPRDKGCQRQGG